MKKTALINGRVHSAKGVAEALLIEGGRIIKIGSTIDIGTCPDTRTIDLKGRSVFPGFSDSHAHFFNWAHAQEALDLGSCHSINDLKNALRTFVKANPSPAGGWIVGYGWNDIHMGREPTRHDIDEIVSDKPVYLRRICGHVATVNSAALKISGVTGDTRVEAGIIELDSSGEPNGIFKEDAMQLVSKHIPELNDKDMLRLLEKYGPEVASYGLTEVNSDDHARFGFDFRRAHSFFNNAALEGRLPFRIRRQLLLPRLELLLDFLSDGYRSGDGHPFCQFGPLKLLTDGSLGGRTALLQEPYSDEPDKLGVAMYTQEELNELVLTAHTSGMQIAAHAIGDGALEMCLNAIAIAHEQGRSLTRHLIVHAQVANDRQLDRMRELRIGAAIQPSFAPSDRTMAIERLGTERGEKSYRWRTMLRKGLVLSAGSDAPIESLRPLDGIHAAVTRTLPGESVDKAWIPAEKLSVAEAINLYTWAGAWNGNNEKRRGEIAQGRDADLVVLAQDPFTVPPSNIGKIEVAMTFCGGRLTYGSEDFSG